MSDRDALSGEMRSLLPGPGDRLALTNDTAERLLSGRPSPATPPAYAPVAGLLAMAAAPAPDAELDVPPLVVAAFRAAQRPSRATRAGAGRPTRAGARRARAPRRFAWIAALAAAVVLLVAGTALATGNLRAHGLRHLHQPGGPDRRVPATTLVTGQDEGGGSGPALPAVSAAGLCRAWVAGNQDAKAKAAAFEALAAAAGGRDRVAAYCRDRVPPTGLARGGQAPPPAAPGAAAGPSSKGAGGAHPACPAAAEAAACGDPGGTARGKGAPAVATQRPAGPPARAHGGGDGR